jgi:hypothetical protein
MTRYGPTFANFAEPGEERAHYHNTGTPRKLGTLRDC